VTGHDHPSPAQTTLQSEPDVTLPTASLGTRFTDWGATAADYYTAAATYQ